MPIPLNYHLAIHWARLYHERGQPWPPVESLDMSKPADLQFDAYGHDSYVADFMIPLHEVSD